MDAKGFWETIEVARADTGRPLEQALRELLAQRSSAEILEYQQHFDAASQALYRWDIWGAAYLIGGGCSDDAFIDFRAGVIGLGKEWFDRVLAQPDSLAEHPLVQAAPPGTQSWELFYEEVNYAAVEAFRQATGSRDDFYAELRQLQQNGYGGRDASMGEGLDFDDKNEMRRRYPSLSSREPRN